METIPKSSCQKIGYLQKPHGIKGELVLQLEDDYTESLEEYPIIFLEIDQLLVPYFPSDEGIRIRSGESALVKLDWVENEIDAKKICGSQVYLKKEDVLFDEEEISLHQLVGYTLFDSTISTVGEIIRVDDYSGNLIFTVIYKKKEILIPFNEDFLIRLDEAEKEIELQCPDGIFNIDD